MSDNQNDNSVYSEEEYKEALAKLNKSKSSREKTVVKEQKDRKKREKVTNNNKTHNKSFIQKCKEDIVIPICFLSMLVFIIVVILYFSLSSYYSKSFGVDINTFRENYTSTQIYNNALLGYNFEIPAVKYLTTQTGIDTNNLKDNDSDKYNYFNTDIPNTANITTGIQGSSRKVDNKLVSLRIVIEYSSDPAFFDTMKLYFASYVQTIYPQLSTDEAMELVLNTINQMENGTSPYIAKGDLSYRIFASNENGISYIAMEFIVSNLLVK